jgi:hypothetical protein
MEYIHFFEIVSQVFPFIGTQNSQGKVQKGPEMDGFPCMVIDFGHVMDLGMAVMAGCDAIGCLGGQDLIGFGLTVGPSLFLETGLEITAAAAAAEVVGLIGGHIDEVLFTHNLFDHVSHVFGNRISQGLSDQLAGILECKFNLTLFVPL